MQISLAVRDANTRGLAEFVQYEKCAVFISSLHKSIRLTTYLLHIPNAVQYLPNSRSSLIRCGISALRARSS
jgi:deoxycytidine triphosphate deaminase